VLFRSLSSQSSQLKSALATSEEEKNALAEDLSKIIASFEENLANVNEKEAQWREEKAELRDKVRAEEEQIDALQAALEASQAEVAMLKGQARLVNEYKHQIAQLTQQLQQSSSREQTLSQRIAQAAAELDSHKDDYDKRISQLLGERKRLNEALGQRDALVEARTAECQEGRRLVLDLQNRVTTLEQLCCGKEDLHLTVERLMSECAAQQATKDLLTTELHRLAEYLLSVSQEKLDLAKQTAASVESHQAKDAEIEALKVQVAKLKKRGPAYAPVKVSAT